MAKVTIKNESKKHIITVLEANDEGQTTAVEIKPGKSATVTLPVGRELRAQSQMAHNYPAPEVSEETKSESDPLP